MIVTSSNESRIIQAEDENNASADPPFIQRLKRQLPESFFAVSNFDGAQAGRRGTQPNLMAVKRVEPKTSLETQRPLPGGALRGHNNIAIIPNREQGRNIYTLVRTAISVGKVG